MVPSPDRPVMPKPEAQPTMTVDEASAVLGLSRASTYEGVARGEIPSIRIGRRLLVPTAALRRMLGVDSPPEEFYASQGRPGAA